MSRHPATLTLKDMQRLAKTYCGRCLSTVYVNSGTKLAWQCRCGYIWDATPDNIKAGNWCVVCSKAKRDKDWLAEMQEIARSHGGRCLSERYEGSKAKLTWQCSEGHVWQSAPKCVKSAQSWCPVCRYDKRRLDLATMQALAASKGGRCLSEHYVSVNHTMRWRCAQGHEWDATGARIQSGSWCKACVHAQLRLTLDDMHELARARSGKCRSEAYTSNRIKLDWECSEGHRWSAVPAHVKNGTWCPVCANRAFYSITDMQKIACARGGECVSEAYVNTETKLAWRCALGHEWSTKPMLVIRGHWCPQCQWLSQCRHERSRRKYLSIRGAKDTGKVW
jgi:hypothetical protein